MVEHLPARTADWDWCEATSVCLRETTRVFGPGANAEDAAQEAVLRAWRHRGSCATPARPHGWLRTIARREAVRILAERTAVPTDDVLGVEAPDHAADAELRADVGRALEGLSVHDRALIVGRYFADMTQEALAAHLGLPEGTTKVQLHRVRARLRKSLPMP